MKKNRIFILKILSIKVYICDSQMLIKFITTL